MKSQENHEIFLEGILDLMVYAFPNLVSQGHSMRAASSASYYDVSALNFPTPTVHVTTVFSNTLPATYTLRHFW